MRGAATTGALAAGLLVRRRYLRWGATDDEVAAALPGDELLARSDLTATRAITVQARPAEVWPWLSQVGQGRGGFYSYDRLENLVGCNIRSADRIVPEWQKVAVGDDVHLHPAVAMLVARMDPGRALVLRGGVPIGTAPPPYDGTWAFVLRDGPHDTTRLLMRERYSYTRWWSALVLEPVELLSALMSRRMLLGIRDRTERVSALSRETSRRAS